MAHEVTLPELGESVTSGIIIEWLVAVGDTVTVDQPLFELSTDKIDTEVPSPVAGVVQELRAEVDDEIEVGAVVLVIGDGDADAAPAPKAEPEAEPEAEAEEAEEPKAEAAPEPKAEEPETPAPAPKAAAPAAPASNDGAADPGTKALTSPLVRKMLRDANVDVTGVQGSGQGGRITREDAEAAIAAPAAAPAAAAPAAAPAAAAPAAAPAAAASAAKRPEASPNQVQFEGRTKIEPLSRIRKSIARHMLDSITTTAQLTAVVEVDLTRVMTTRARTKDQFKATHGVSLSPLPIIARAVTMTLPRHPALNSSIDTEAGEATYHNYVNLGMAVDTELGLIVPNIKDAQDLTIAGLAKTISDVAERARTKKLQPDDISGGTFTITNTGSRGAMIDTPILNPPEVAILATTLIEKRPVVVTDEFGSDAIAIRWMSYVCLSYDHRMVDGADAARFLGDLKFVLEQHDFTPELGV